MGTIQHVKTSAIADGGDTDLVRPSDWNSAHAYTLQDAVSLSGNTAGVLANISSGTMYLAGGNNVTLSQNANSVTISGAPATTLSLWPSPLPASTAVSTYYSGSTSQGAGGNSTQSGYTFSIYLSPVVVDYPLAYTQLMAPISNNTAAGTGSVTMLWSFGLYSKNDNTLSKVDDFYGGMWLSQNSITAQTWSIFTFSTAGVTSANSSGFAGLSTASLRTAQGNVSASIQGVRRLKIEVPTNTITKGHYWFGMAFYSLSTGANVYSNVGWVQNAVVSSQNVAELGQATNSNSLTAFLLGHGNISTTFTSVSDAANFFAMPNEINIANIISTATSAQRYHMIVLNGIT